MYEKKINGEKLSERDNEGIGIPASVEPTVVLFALAGFSLKRLLPGPSGQRPTPVLQVGQGPFVACERKYRNGSPAINQRRATHVGWSRRSNLVLSACTQANHRGTVGFFRGVSPLRLP